MKVIMFYIVATSVVIHLSFVTICGANELQPAGIDLKLPPQPTEQPEQLNTTTVAPITTTPASNTTTTTTTTTTPKPTTTTITPSPSPNTTTTTPTTPTTPSTTTPVPTTPSTTAKPTPRPEPDRKFDGTSFIGGMVLTMGLMAIGFVSWKFYKARTERNYHTL